MTPVLLFLPRNQKPRRLYRLHQLIGTEKLHHRQQTEPVSCLSGYSQTELNEAAEHLNTRPRKTLGFVTPAYKLNKVLLRPTESIAFVSRISFTVTGEEILLKQSKYIDAQIMNILKQAEGGVPVTELCRDPLPGRVLRGNA